jgi:hypothetical protein
MTGRRLPLEELDEELDEELEELDEELEDELDEPEEELDDELFELVELEDELDGPFVPPPPPPLLPQAVMLSTNKNRMNFFIAKLRNYKSINILLIFSGGILANKLSEGTIYLRDPTKEAVAH